MSDLEDQLAHQMKAAGLPDPVRELTFAKPRRWRFDFAFLDRLVAIEVEGGSWIGGRHTRGSGFEKDIEKSNAAQIAGWTVLRVTGAMIRDGRALATIEELFGGNP